MRRRRGIPAVRAKIPQHRNKDRRGNQTAAAAGAVENLVRLENGVYQRNGTNRARKLRSVVQHADAVLILLR
jgi:hypothetical protein